MSTSNRRFPAEWEKQQGILLCFPHNGKDWPGKYEAIQWAFVEFIKKVADVEEVFLIVANEKLKEKVIGMLEMAHVKISNVSFIIQKTNRSWMRALVWCKSILGSSIKVLNLLQIVYGPFLK